MARPADASLPPPTVRDAWRALPVDDAGVLAVAGVADPVLAALAREVEGRRDALALARLRYIPDFNPFVGTDGAAAQMAGIVVSIPTMLREVGAMVRESRAELDGALARMRQTDLDRRAAVVAALTMVRDGERRAALADGVLRRSAERVVAATETAYANDTASFEEMVAARTALLDVALLRAEAGTARARSLAELEALLGVDLEALDEAAATMAPHTVAAAKETDR
jgi:hypothetical protein